jgi:glucan phosphoethanolaminetransferase (alkaline phosphatase superfamily)
MEKILATTQRICHDYLMFKKLRPHFILALIFLVLTLAQQYLFYAIKGFDIVPMKPEKYLVHFAFMLGATFIKGPLRVPMLAFTFVLNFFQMAHLSYYGTLVAPSEIAKLLEVGEIYGTLKENIFVILIPVLFTLVPLVIGYWANKKFHPNYRTRWVTALFAAYILFNPIRTFVTKNTWGRQPNEKQLGGSNIYLSTSYFLGRILPSKIAMVGDYLQGNSSGKLKLTKTDKPKWDKIIIVMGESLAPRHMSHFGYTRPTTPYLDTLKGQKNFYSTVGLSSGVSTDISIAFFLNQGFGASCPQKASKGNHCLFKLAKDQQYATHFLSMQSQDQLNNITPFLCGASLDSFSSMEDIDSTVEDHQAAVDRKMIEPFAKLIETDAPQLVMLHQRGSHSPFNLRYRKVADVFSKEKDVDPRINAYDNSVIEFDLFMKDLVQTLNKQKGKTLLVYLSDHGEELGDKKGVWGHGGLSRNIYEVPMVIMSFNQELPSVIKEFPKYLTQYNLSLFLAQQMGYTPNQSVAIPPKDYVIYGNDIDGFAGKAVIKFLEDGTYKDKIIL